MTGILARRAALLSVAAIALLACGGDDDSGTDHGTPSGSITVFAAASLTESFTELGDAFERHVDGTTVTLNFAASSELATQIDEGAPADVYASADEANMQRLVDGSGTIGEPAVFATNALRIIVEPGNPLGIAALEDLADPAVLFITAAPEVPIGRYTQVVLEAAGIEATPRSLEESVRGVVGKVALGEADAGIVYATDVLAAGDRADGVDIPAESNVVASYPIAVPAEASNVTTAEAFVDFVLGETGQGILATYGFSAP